MLLLAADARQPALDPFLLGCPAKATKTAKEYSNGCNSDYEKNDSDGHEQLHALHPYLTANSSVDNNPHKNWLSEA